MGERENCRTKSKYWIVPCRESIFLVDAALDNNREQDGNTFVDWRQSNDYAVGDVIFLYKTSPKAQVSYRMEVIATNLSYDESTDKEVFWKDKALFYDGLGTHRYVRFRLQTTYPGGFFSIKALREHGLRGNIQGVTECKNAELLHFLKGEVIDISPSDNDVMGSLSVSEYSEGGVHEVVLNRFERSRAARDACISAKGCRCIVCGIDFEQSYGEIGKGFIHVHHLVPVSSIGKAYRLNPQTDLVPVCPNCHNMLHRKVPPYTISELQNMLNPQ